MGTQQSWDRWNFSEPLSKHYIFNVITLENMSEPVGSSFPVYQYKGARGEDSLVEVVEYYSTVLAEVDIAINYTLL